jgi:quinolinate synthase
MHAQPWHPGESRTVCAEISAVGWVSKHPGIQVIVHPECRWEVCRKAGALGSTEGLIKIVEDAPACPQSVRRSAWLIGQRYDQA